MFEDGGVGRPRFRMRRSVSRLVAIGLLAVGLGQAALAADVDSGQPTVDRGRIIYAIDGRIEPGLTDRVIQFLDSKKFPGGSVFGTRAIVTLNSQDGDFAEGLKLGLLFASSGVETDVPDGSVCIGPCSIAFMGGSVSAEEGQQFSSRTLAVGGVLGFHAPTPALPEGNVNRAASQAAFDAALATLSAITSSAEALDLRRSLFPAMLTSGNGKFYKIDKVDELGLFGIATDIHVMPKVFTKSMATNLCLNSYAWGEDRSALEAASQTGTGEQIASVKANGADYGNDATALTRTVISVAQAGEGNSYYCVVDHRMVAGELKAICRGYLLSYDLQEAVGQASALGRNGEGVDLSCRMPIPVDSIDPSGYHRVVNFPPVYAIVPAATRIGDIKDVIARYVHTEKDLAEGQQ